MTRKIFLLILILILVGHPAQADILELMSGKSVRGKIVSSDKNYVRINIGDETIVTFYQDEIKRIVLDQPEQKTARSFLWKVTSPETKIYLLGSMHLGKKDMYPLAGAIEKAFQVASILVVEVDVENGDPLALQQKIAAQGTYESGDRLENHISAQTRKKLRSRLEQYGISTGEFSAMKPWFAALTLQLLQIKDLGFDPDDGIDRHFLQMARGKKKILELETFDQQLAFLDGIEDQEMFLKYTLDSLDETESMINQILNSWRDGDAEKMEKITISEVLSRSPETQPIFQRVLFDRNVSMTQQIEGFLKTDQIYFIVVGAAHLIGEKGVVELLKKKGYQVEQL